MDDLRNLADVATLEPSSSCLGVGNGLRAVGAARRLCALTGARLTIVWEFGNFDALIAPEHGVEVLDRVPAHADSLRHIRMPLFSEGGNAGNRRIPVCEDRTIIVESWFWFCASEEPLVYEKNALTEWLPRPAGAIEDTVRAFADDNFHGTVGMHIRSGDNDMSIVTTPLADFIHEAERVVDEGHTIFLATDSAETERVILKRFGDRIIVFPKGWDLPSMATYDVHGRGGDPRLVGKPTRRLSHRFPRRGQRTRRCR